MQDGNDSVSENKDIHSTGDETQIYQPPPVERATEEGPGISGAFRYALVFERGPRAGLSFVLGEGDTTAGRDPESSIFLPDITVSRHHAKFTVDEDRLFFTDLGSTNGTYVNGSRLDDGELFPSDEVIIGKFHFIVARGDG